MNAAPRGTPSPAPAKLDPPAPARLLELLRRMAALAGAVLRKVRFSLLLAILSAVWLTFYLQGFLHLEWGGIAVLLGLLSLPALLLGYGYVVLQGVVELPEMAGQIGGALNDAASPLWARLRGIESAPTPPRRGRLRQLLRMAGLLLELSRIGALPEAARGTLVLANPLFILLLAGAYVSSLILFLLALATVMVYIL
jgi:hypothetical protein